MRTALIPRRRSVIVLTAAFVAALAPPAAAKHGHLAPPGNSGIGQYVEIIPTASGSRPTNTVHRHQGTPSNTASSGTLAPVPEFASPGSSGVSGATAQALSADGPAGVAATNLARATDPASATAHRHGLAEPAAPVTSVGRGPSPVGSVLGTLTGSSSSGGLGPMLPVLLLITLVGAGALALIRHRNTT